MDDKENPFSNFPKLLESSKYTQEKLARLRARFQAALQESPHKDSITIITTGSYGREEASEESDLDLFILFDADELVEDVIPDELAEITKIVEDEVPATTGDTSTFGTEFVIRFSEMLQNIGGIKDNNESLTRRMLFLLEGTWLYGEDRFHDYQRRLLEKYIKKDSPDGQISKFFLNEIIRYYRTIATDFEFKVSEENKEWGLRSTKLRFSRKLLYFGGIIAVAEVSELTQDEKLENIIKLFQLPVLTRISVLSEKYKTSASNVFRIYEKFLNSISDTTIRETLRKTAKAQRNKCDEYISLRELGSDFSNGLAEWIEKCFKDSHPIHHSLIF